MHSHHDHFDQPGDVVIRDDQDRGQFWGLVNQVPVYVIEYEARQYRPDLHVRYHASDSEADTIKTYLWPALLEGQNGPCVQKGVVIT